MTKEEAIKMLKSKMDGSVDTSYEWVETVRLAIKALEQQSCEDCISREATIEAIYKKYIGGKDAIKNAPINDLYAEGLAEAVDAVWDMPSVQPTRPTSRWSRQTDTYHGYYECENCGIGVGLDDVRNFCPNCGAKMEEIEE